MLLFFFIIPLYVCTRICSGNVELGWLRASYSSEMVLCLSDYFVESNYHILNEPYYKVVTAVIIVK
jgi:hypothetical protein